MSADRFDPSMNGYRVIQDGKRGALVRCFSRTKRVYYWRVRFDTGTWAWPERLIAESSGPCLSRCSECLLGYYGPSPTTDGLCGNCVALLDRTQLGTHDRDRGPSHEFGRRRR